MNRLLCITTAALMLSALGACTADNDELIQWMEQQHKEIKPNIAPIFPPKKFDPQAYLGVTGVEPFGTQKLVPVGGPANGKSQRAAGRRQGARRRRSSSRIRSTA